MSDDPTESAGVPVCAWCGGGPVPPSRGTKPRAYCKPGCKQRAYEARRLEKQLAAVREEEAEKRAPLLFNAYVKGRREEAELGAGKSRDDARSDEGKSRDVPPNQQVTPPGAEEECPYCRRPVVALLAHMRQCPEGPGNG